MGAYQDRERIGLLAHDVDDAVRTAHSSAASVSNPWPSKTCRWAAATELLDGPRGPTLEGVQDPIVGPESSATPTTRLRMVVHHADRFKVPLPDACCFLKLSDHRVATGRSRCTAVLSLRAREGLQFGTSVERRPRDVVDYVVAFFVAHRADENQHEPRGAKCRTLSR